MDLTLVEVLATQKMLLSVKKMDLVRHVAKILIVRFLKMQDTAIQALVRNALLTRIVDHIQ